MIPTSRNMARSLAALVLLTSFVAGQRPFFAGSRPIGFPETPNRTTTQDPLGNRFGEGTTERLPIEANGDRDLIDRLSKLPIDKQPFWFINWQALEEHRKKPQTYPQKPNVFVDSVPLNSNTQSSTFSSNTAGFSSNSGANSFNANTGNSFGLNSPSGVQFSAPAAPSSFNNLNLNTGNRNNFDGIPNRVNEAQFGFNPTIGNNPVPFNPNNQNTYSFVSNTMDINGQSFNSPSNDGHSYTGSNSGPNPIRPNSEPVSNVGPSPTFNSNVGPSPVLNSNVQPSPLSTILRPNSGSSANVGPNPNFSSDIPSSGFPSNIGPNSVISSNIGPNPVFNSNLPSSGLTSNIGPNSGIGTNFSASNLYPQNANPAALLLNKLPPNASTGNLSFNAFANSFNNSYVHNQNGFFVQSYKTDSFVSHSSSFGSSTKYPVRAQQPTSQEYY
ncbi:unnamed protein product [Chrysodeixis includens]|uniref:Uncharacterized protein n=1 Tax=Chrysodeixis includens TaxID=689277 RepID=A0A9P0BRD9_CHRIL|nr:unnamed protein product [Chrysodeixis includens]